MVDSNLYWSYMPYDSKGNAIFHFKLNKALYVLL